MHVLVTNDDGPPDAAASPYIASFVNTLQRAGVQVSVIVPTTQRSWIGKAHLLPPSSRPQNQGVGSVNEHVTDLITPSYYYPSTGEILAAPLKRANPSVHANGDLRCDEEPWLLVPGTPATCTQLGLFHFFQDKGPVDLVVSGPNHGRNTTAAFGLSSGTLGGAFEAAICGMPAIAVSYAFFTRQESPEMVNEANNLAVKLLKHLSSQWGVVDNQEKSKVDVYSINIPLVEGIDQKPVRWTWMLDNKWTGSSLYKEIDSSVQTTSAPESEVETNRPRYFKWSPTFSQVWKTVEDSPPGNDGWAIREHCTSVTPLRANFMHAGPYGDGIGEELKF